MIGYEKRIWLKLVCYTFAVSLEYLNRVGVLFVCGHAMVSGTKASRTQRQ